MTTLFRASNWVSESKDSIVSRGVTTCTGMTAHTVVLAQTRVGFLSGGRKKSFLDLPQDEQTVQLEEAYARATVAITRARSLCLIMGPLDMKGLLGAATVMGAGRANFYLHDDLCHSPPDEAFIDMLKQNCCLAGPHFPPPAIVEVLQDYVTNFHKVRRLHLIVVDLWRPWKYNTARARDVTDQLWHIQDGENTRRVSPFRPDGPQPPLRCRRFAYGFALDSSEFPCYLVWPQREERSYVLLDTATGDTLILAHWECNIFMIPLHWSLKYAYAAMPLSSSACEMMSSCLTCTLPRPGCCAQNLGHTKNTWLTRMLRQLTGIKFLPQSSMWPRTRLTLTQERMSQSLPLVTLKKVAVKVTPHRMNLPLHWLQIPNSMSSCKLPMQQLAVIL